MLDGEPAQALPGEYAMLLFKTEYRELIYCSTTTLIHTHFRPEHAHPCELFKQVQVH
jgi:hypothetical protein